LVSSQSIVEISKKRQGSTENPMLVQKVPMHAVKVGV